MRQTSAKPIGGVSSLTDQGGNSHGHHAATDGRLPRLLMSADRDSHVRPPRLFHVRRQCDPAGGTSLPDTTYTFFIEGRSPGHPVEASKTRTKRTLCDS